MACSQRIAATVVPQEPAPMTATDTVDSTVGSIRAAMLPHSARTETSPRRSSPRAGVVVPIRAFALGKARLADALEPADRVALSRRWADRVLQADAPLPVVVVTSDSAV